MKTFKKEAPYMVASYIRCKDVQESLAKIDIPKCVYLFKLHVEKHADIKDELRKEVDKILTLEKRVYELERKSFLTNRNIDTAKMTEKELFVVVKMFHDSSMTIGEIETYIKAM